MRASAAGGRGRVGRAAVQLGLVAAARGARLQVDAGGPGGAAVGALGGGPSLAPARAAARHRLH